MSSSKQLELISLYQQMALSGVNRSGPVSDGRPNSAPSDYSLMNIRLFKEFVRPHFRDCSVSSVLDYGCGNTSWDAPGFADNLSAKEYFMVRHVHRYEPSMGLCELAQCDAVVCFDVLEHIFLADVSSAVWDLFAHARKLVIANVACYPARAVLPTGENAHVTIRPPAWWHGVFDSIAPAFPSITYRLFASTSFGNAIAYRATSMDLVISQDGYERHMT